MRYRYSNAHLEFDLRAATIGPNSFIPHLETIFLSEPRDNGAAAYRITRWFSYQEIDLDCGSVASHMLSKTDLVMLPLERTITFPWMELDFTNPALLKKMKTLLFFS
jgi:hypothetical protein